MEFFLLFVFAVTGECVRRHLTKKITLQAHEIVNLRLSVMQLNREFIILSRQGVVSRTEDPLVKPAYKDTNEAAPERTEASVSSSGKSASVAPPLNATVKDIARESARAKPDVQNDRVKILRPPQKSLKDHALWRDFEKQFAGNVTGVLGTLAVILGVIFLAVYAAIQLNPLGRFGIVCGFAAGFYVLSVFLNRKAFWRNIALWIRSASGVTFLMGCLGSVGIESMKWVHNPAMALALLSLGLAANLALGFLAGGELFASIHVLFSLGSLAVVPLTGTTFTLSAIIAFFGILMGLKDRRWDRHIVATTLSFTLLHFYWLYVVLEGVDTFPLSHPAAILICFAVGAAAIAGHYRKVYQNLESSHNALMSHLTAWATLGINLYAHSSGSRLSTGFLALGAIVAFYMSRQARRLSISWLYICDRLMALLLALLATVSLRRYGLEAFDINVLACMVATLFLRIVAQSYEKIIFKFANVVVLLAFFSVALQSLDLLENKAIEVSSLLLLTASFALLCYVIPYLQKQAREQSFGFTLVFRNKVSVTTFLEIPFAFHGFLTLLFAVNYHQESVAPFHDLKFGLLFIPFLISGYALNVRQKVRDAGLDLAVFFGTVATSLVTMHLILDRNLNLRSDVLLTFGLLCWGFLAYHLSWYESRKQRATWAGVGLIWVTSMMACYRFTIDISPALTGISWLFLSIVTGESRSFLSPRPDSASKHAQTETYLVYCGLLSVLAFMCRFFVVDLANETLAFGMIRIRILLEVFSLGVVLYWMLFGPIQRTPLGTRAKSWLAHTLEAFLLLFVAYVSAEVSSHLHPVIWALASFACFYAGKRWVNFNRLMLYSYMAYFGSLFHIAFLSTTIATPSSLFLDQSWVMGLFAIALNTVFMILVYRDSKTVQSRTFELPFAAKWLSGFKGILGRHEVKVLLYPLFTMIAMFLYWSFDHTILSLLWVVECFVLFLISIFMREPQFRVASMAGIGIIFLRIVFYDLTGQDFFLKAVVFISVGVILIAMNAIYNKYRHRYDAN